VKPYEPNLNRDNNNGWNFKKFLIALVFILIGAIVITYINYSVENKETNTMSELYEKVEKSMVKEDMELLNKLSDKARQLLPDDEKEKLLELQIIFSEYGYSALTEEDTRLMTELNKKAISLLPEKDRVKLFNLFKKLSDVLED
jgi:hypothetical protein